MIDKYKDMLEMPHYEPRNHKRIPLLDRASQFAPFSALTGFEDAINEVLRIVENKIELTDEKQEEINLKLQYILSSGESAKITYFVQDKIKNGGQYKSISGKVIKFDEIKKVLLISDGTKIKLDDILEINSTFLTY